MSLLFYLKSPNEWIDVGEPVPYPEEIEYIRDRKPVLKEKRQPKPFILPKEKPNFQADEDVLLLLLTELDKYDD